MRQSKYRYGLVLAALVVLIGALPVVAADEEGFKQIEEKGIRFMWAIDGDLLQIQVVVPTTGWIGVGFEPVRKMQGANFIIGYVKDGKAVIEDHYGVKKKKHKKDTDLEGIDNVQDAEGSEKEGVTKLGFKIPLDSGDEFDNKLEEGKTVTLLLAYGKDDDTSSKHRVVIKTSIKL
jgi:hypothetical protein